jgi:hypothetical protein
MASSRLITGSAGTVDDGLFVPVPGVDDEGVELEVDDPVVDEVVDVVVGCADVFVGSGWLDSATAVPAVTASAPTAMAPTRSFLVMVGPFPLPLGHHPPCSPATYGRAARWLRRT